MKNPGKKVKNSNCNGIPMADDIRIRRTQINQYTMRHPVPSQNDIGKSVIINEGVLGRSIPELGFFESKRQGNVSAFTVRYSGIIRDIKSHLVFIERVEIARKGEAWDFISEEGYKYRMKICCVRLDDFKSGYARYVITPTLYTKHLGLSTRGGGTLSAVKQLDIFGNEVQNFINSKPH